MYYHVGRVCTRQRRPLRDGVSSVGYTTITDGAVRYVVRNGLDAKTRTRVASVSYTTITDGAARCVVRNGLDAASFCRLPWFLWGRGAGIDVGVCTGPGK